MTAHTGWRLVCEDGINPYRIAEFGLCTILGGSSAAVGAGGTAFASTTQFGDVAANAFDGSVSTAWSANGGTGEYVGYIFSTPQSIVEIFVQAYNNTNIAATQSPLSAKIQVSDNSTNGTNGTWTDLLSITFSHYWSAGEIKRVGTSTTSPSASIAAEQSRTLVGVTQNDQIDVEQARMYVGGRIPAQDISAEQARMSVGVRQNDSINTQQARMFVAAKGRIDNRRLRAWTFSLDGHDFYVLRLGQDSTLVYDKSTDSWSKWNGASLAFLRAHVGTNWLGMGRNSLAANALTNVVAGDDDQPYLWSMNPNVGYDEDVATTAQTSFPRKVLGGLPMKTRKTQPIGAAYLTVDAGDPQMSGAAFTLRTSDDYGKTWINHGSVLVDSDTAQEIVWRSLGLLRQPGKAFEISDDGASVRIDSLEIR
jgi:hypothetical protein